MSCTPNDPTAPNFLTHFQAVEPNIRVRKAPKVLLSVSAGRGRHEEVFPLRHFWFCAVLISGA